MLQLLKVEEDEEETNINKNRKQVGHPKEREITSWRQYYKEISLSLSLSVFIYFDMNEREREREKKVPEERKYTHTLLHW